MKIPINELVAWTISSQITSFYLPRFPLATTPHNIQT
uniref:Uncharacterized protein n=1 Tax=Rhizophora mucronata TaxID=61149 RepID=A0A2P2IVT7_RHIMU